MHNFCQQFTLSKKKNLKIKTQKIPTSLKIIRNIWDNVVTQCNKICNKRCGCFRTFYCEMLQIVSLTSYLPSKCFNVLKSNFQKFPSCWIYEITRLVGKYEVPHAIQTQSVRKQRAQLWFNRYVQPSSFTKLCRHPHTHTLRGTDQDLAECCAEGVQCVRALRGSVEQVTDGDGTARCHWIQHCITWKYERDYREYYFPLVCKADITYRVSCTSVKIHRNDTQQWERLCFGFTRLATQLVIILWNVNMSTDSRSVHSNQQYIFLLLIKQRVLVSFTFLTVI